MSSNKHVYENPLTKRYSSKEMSFLWSPHNKFTTWRKLWLYLAESEKELGIDIKDSQLEELRNNVDNINYEVAEAKEKELRHDVMSHIHAYGQQCPEAMPIIHLGATSQYVNDNTEILQLHGSLDLIKTKTLVLIDHLSHFAQKYKDMPTLGFTHFQAAQLVTVGKRAVLWCQDFLLDLERIEYELGRMRPRGVKGTTGTQASFLELFEGDHSKVVELDRKVVSKLGFKESIPVSGQTYTRKVDFFVLSVLSGLAQSAHKMATDIRLLAHLKEVEEPFEKHQVGSSAMAYKRNPMRSERICSLSRYVINLLNNTATTHAVQWFERTLDDSANRRLVLPEAFLATDATLGIAINVVDGLHVWPNRVRAHIQRELPFMTTEAILMHCVKEGGDRQDLHEAIREHSIAAGNKVKRDGAENDLLDRIKTDDKFKAVHDKLEELIDPKLFIGRAAEQVDDFVKNNVGPALREYKERIDAFKNPKLNV